MINTVAGLVNDDRHKVNLTAPDKVILVDIYQVCDMSKQNTRIRIRIRAAPRRRATPLTLTFSKTVCGMSVVDGDWDELKRYNLTELYSAARNASGSNKDER